MKEEQIKPIIDAINKKKYEGDYDTIPLEIQKAMSLIDEWLRTRTDNNNSNPTQKDRRDE